MVIAAHGPAFYVIQELDAQTATLEDVCVWLDAKWHNRGNDNDSPLRVTCVYCSGSGAVPREMCHGLTVGSACHVIGSAAGLRYTLH